MSEDLKSRDESEPNQAEERADAAKKWSDRLEVLRDKFDDLREAKSGGAWGHEQYGWGIALYQAMEQLEKAFREEYSMIKKELGEDKE